VAMSIDDRQHFTAPTGPHDGAGRDGEPGPAPDLPPVLPELPMSLHGLYASPAPAFPTNGTPLRARLKRAANVALNMIGLSQRRFNESVLEALTLMMSETRGLRAWLEERAPLLPSAPDMMAGIEALRGQVESLRADVHHLRDHVSGTSEVVSALGRRHGTLESRLDALAPAGASGATPPHPGGQVGRLTETIDAVGQRLQELHAAQDDYARWLALLRQKYEALSMEARAIVEERSEPVPEPRVVDPAGYARRIAQMPDGVRANLGSGEQPWPEHVNVDLRPLPGVDIVADARRLPFEPGSLAELASAHLVEHFREHQLRTRILPYWRSLLRPDGILRIICPNWEAMLERLHDGRMTLADFKTVTFGLQDYEGDDHFAMYTPDMLGRLLREVGFTQVEVVTRERMNGLCPEMELVARS
jgi:predicted SAM-dependent methyltransferase